MSAGTVRRNEGRITGVGGLQLAYRTWETSAPRAAVILVHGLSDHTGRYEEFGSALAAAGFHVFALDQRGHGASEGRRGHAASFDHLLQDLDRFRREVQGIVDSRLPLFLVGHSMGGLVALRHLEEYDTPFRGAILISPWLGTAQPVAAWKRALAGSVARLVPALPFRARIPPAFLSHDADVVAAYRDDPLVHDTITPRLFVEAEKAMARAHERAGRLTVPLLFLLAGDDRIVDTARAEAFANDLDPAAATVRVIEGAFHELLHETRRAAVRHEICDWMAARLASSAVGGTLGGPSTG